MKITLVVGSLRRSQWSSGLGALTLVLCSGGAAGFLHAQSAGVSNFVEHVDGVIGAALAAGKAPGLSVAILRGSEPILIKGYGLADVENRVPVTSDSVFRIGSLTKQFTAAAVIKLAEQGRLKLNATVAEVLPDYKGPGGAATISQLLTHTSGIPSLSQELLGAKFGELTRLDLTNAQVIDLFAARPLDFGPGTRWSYSNSAYFLLGIVVEKISGTPYAEHLRETLFEPLGLAHTTYCGQRALIANRVAGYDLDGDRVVNAAPLSMNIVGAAGALCSTPRDLVRWIRALAAGQVVSREAFSVMSTPVRLPDGSASTTAYGLSRGRLGEFDVIQQAGGINGFSAFVAHYPQENLTIAVTTNGATSANRVQQQIARTMLGIPDPPIR